PRSPNSTCPLVATMKNVLTQLIVSRNQTGMTPMTTANPTNLKNSFTVAITLTLLLISGAVFAADIPVAEQGIVNTVNKISRTDEIALTGFAATIHSDDGIPLAREDVIPLQRVVSGNNQTLS